MASFAKLTAFLLLLNVLFIQIHARESNFFSKVPNTNSKETQFPNKLDDPVVFTKEETTTIPQEQEPNFIPQTQDNGYGLYGHESGQFSPSETKFSDPGSKQPFTTTTNNNNNNYNYDKYNNNYNNYKTDIPSYRTESEEYYNNDNNNNFENTNSKLYDNSFYYNKDLYEGGGRGGERQSFDNVRLSKDDDFTNTPVYNQQDNKNYYSSSNGGDNVNFERQGMSDTRFAEGGKYFYDLNHEPHHYRSSRRGNNGGGYFGNNGNTYEYGNNNRGGYQNDEAEFQEEPNEFVP